MPTQRLSMGKTREILRLTWDKKRSGRQAAISCKVSPSTVSSVLRRGQVAGLKWPLPADLDDTALDALLYPAPLGKVERPEPDYAAVYRGLKDKGVTKQLAWMEYRENYPDGFGYSRFCWGYPEWSAHLHVTMRQTHRAGEKLFIDYAGHTIGVTDGDTGEVTEMQVFVATLGASNFTYAELHPGQDLHSWIGGHVRAFEYIGGVPKSACSTT